MKRIAAFLAPSVVLFAIVAPAVWRAVTAYCYHHEDLGIYAEALARLSLTSLNPYLDARGLRIFSDHFDPILFLAVPLRLLFAPWQAALLAELLFVAAAAVPCAWILAKRRVDLATCLLIGALLFCEPAVLRAVRFPVHPTTWAIGPMMLVVVALLEKRYRWLFVALVLLFACKEEFPFFGLMLGGALVVTRERRVGAAVVALSLAWLVFAFVVRARLTGPTSSYGALIFSGLADDPVSYVRARLTAPGLYIGLWDFVAPLLPILLLAALRRTAVPWVLLVAALPLLAIRFLGLAWQHHYLAPLVPIAIAVVLQVRNQTTLPRWCVAATLLILLALDFSSLRFAASRWNGGVAAAPHFCPRLPQRIAELDGASARILADTSGNALVEGNLFAKLAERGDVYVTGNFQPPPQHYRFVLLERRPHGDPYPHDYAWIDALIASVRESSPTLLVDDDDVFFAEGDFAL